MKGLINLTNKYWTIALQISLAIVSLVSSAILPDQFFATDTDRIKSFGQLINAAMLLILFIPMTRYRTGKYVKYWLSLAILLFVLFLITASKFFFDTQSRTVSIRGEVIVIGTLENMKAVAKQQKILLEQHYGRPLSLRDCILYNAGNVDDFWDENVLNDNRNRLILEFLLAICFFVITLITSLQAIKCQKSSS